MDLGGGSQNRTSWHHIGEKGFSFGDRRRDRIRRGPQEALEAQLPIYWVSVFGFLYKLLLSITQEPTIWVPGLLGKDKDLFEATPVDDLKGVQGLGEGFYLGFRITRSPKANPKRTLKLDGPRDPASAMWPQDLY